MGKGDIEVMFIFILFKYYTLCEIETFILYEKGIFVFLKKQNKTKTGWMTTGTKSSRETSGKPWGIGPEWRSGNLAPKHFPFDIFLAP